MKNIKDFIIESVNINESYSPSGNFDSIKDVLNEFNKYQQNNELATWCNQWDWSSITEDDFIEINSDEVEQLFLSRKKQKDNILILFKNSKNKFQAYSIFSATTKKNLSTLDFVKNYEGKIKTESIGPEINSFQSGSSYSAKQYYNTIKNYKAYKANIDKK